MLHADDAGLVDDVSFRHAIDAVIDADPYKLTVMDLDGRVGIDYGVYGVPETYVIDKAGVIRMKHTGPITPDVLGKKIMPLLAELNK